MKLVLIALAASGLFSVMAGASYAQAPSVCPDNFVAFAGTTAPLPCSCTAEAVTNGEAQATVYGMDVYTADSPVCLSAVHAGIIPRQGGDVTVVPEAGRAAYAGLTRNGVTSRNWGQYDSSFRFEGGGDVAQAPAGAGVPVPGGGPPAPGGGPVPGGAGAPAQAAGAPSVCPDNFVAFAGTTAPLPCSCTAEAVTNGEAQATVYGMDVYTDDSPICLAAVHAGMITREGGDVIVVPEAGRQAYAGVTRNDISSRNWGATDASFRFEGVAVQAAAAGGAAPAGAAGPAGVSVCPDNFVAFAGTTTPLTCSCTAEAVTNGEARATVYGMDLYTADSPLCLAAVHAGIITREGGEVTILPEAGQNAYAGVTRNEVASRNWGQYDSSFRFQATAPPPTVAAAVAPVQQPIAQTIQQTGTVALYIQFALDSDELEPAAMPVLNELRNTLQGAPDLRLALVGHTDSTGAAEYNRDLSLRRAQSVMTWLVGQGVEASRLTVDGKGFDEPIADNATDLGRAQNRRVQAVRL